MRDNPKRKDKAGLLAWLDEGNCCVADYDEHPFLIVEDCRTTESRYFSVALLAAGIGEDDWGYADEYTTCSGCGKIIRTSPDSYDWKPDFDVDDGEIYCSACIEKDEYVKRYVAKSTASSFLLKPEDYEFRLCLVGLEYGLHQGQADDPSKVLEWCKRHRLDVAFVVYPSQFYTSFDVWVRLSEPDGRRGRALTDEELEGVERSLGGTHYSDLRPRSWLNREFTQWPTPAMNLEAALKSIGGKK